MDTSKIMGVVRAAIAGIGGLLMGLGYADADLVAGVNDAVTTIAGAAAVVAAAVASVYAKIKS